MFIRILGIIFSALGWTYLLCFLGGFFVRRFFKKTINTKTAIIIFIVVFNAIFLIIYWEAIFIALMVQGFMEDVLKLWLFSLVIFALSLLFYGKIRNKILGAGIAFLFVIGGMTLNLGFYDFDVLLCQFRTNTLFVVMPFLSDTQDLCRIEIAVEKNKPELCGKINVNDNKDDCYCQMGKKTYDPSLCEKCKEAGGGYNAFYCYIEAAKKKEDISLCNEFRVSWSKYEEDRKWCIKEFMKYFVNKNINEEENLNLCEKFDDEYAQKMCVGQFLKQNLSKIGNKEFIQAVQENSSQFCHENDECYFDYVRFKRYFFFPCEDYPWGSQINLCREWIKLHPDQPYYWANSSQEKKDFYVSRGNIEKLKSQLFNLCEKINEESLRRKCFDFR